MSRYYAAFDGAVSAAGYNAFHELIRFGVPSVFVPIERETDDQEARARHADETGVGLGATGPGDPRLEGMLEALLDRRRREAMRERLDALRPENGAGEAARWLERLVGDPPGAGAAAPRRPRRSPRRLGPSARRGAAWLASVPRTIARLGSQTVSMPRPRTLVVALGLEGEDLVREVEAALAQTPDLPERVLVVTDSPAIGALRRLGVGVEQVPGPGARQAALAGGDYGRFLRARLGLVLAHRPRLRRVVGVGDVPAELLEAATAPPRRRAQRLR
jgi:Glycosyltransferase family 28 C-terminal domain